MSGTRKTWREKLEDCKNLPRVEPITEKQSRRWGRGTEDAARGKTEIPPYWRTLKSGGVINEKYPGGRAGQKNCWSRKATSS